MSAHISRIQRYTALMAKAATGDRKAAQDLLLGGWWPGDPYSEASQDRVIEVAQFHYPAEVQA